MLGIFGKHIGMIWGKILGYPSTTYDGTGKLRYYKMRPFVYGQRVSECDADFDHGEPTVLPCCFGLVGFGLKGEAAASDIKLRHGQWSGAVLNWQVRKIKGPFSRNVLLTISWDGAKDQSPFRCFVENCTSKESHDLIWTIAI
ncbi:hypothetical protein EJB05_23632, partial [Eragrostis curvula]